EIARKEGWRMIYDYDTFPNLLKKLENGQIDLMTAIAYSEERARIFSFTNETLISNWGVIVSKQRYDSILELHNLKVAGVSRDIYTESFKKISRDFELNCEILEIEGDYKQVLEAVRSGYADVGVVSRIYGSLYAKDYGLETTNIIFSPISLKFASKNRELLSIIDKHLAEMKADSNSAYYRSLDKWFGVKAEVLPTWGYHLIALGGIIATVLFIGNVILGREVKKRSEKIAENERFLKTIFNTIQDGISVLNDKMEIIAVNNTMEKWYAKSMPLLGKKCYEAYHGRNEPCKECPTIRSISSRKVENAIVPGAKGSEVEYLELFSYPVFDEKGNLKMFVEFVRNITEKKRAEAQLKEALEQYRYLWENANDLMFIQDLKGNFIDVNRKGLELFGYERGSGITVWDVVDPRHHEYVKEKINEILTSKKPTMPYELLCRAKDGREIWLEIVAHPVIKDEKIVAIHGIARDITERKKLLEQLEKDIMVIAYLVDRIRNPLTVARAFCELRSEVGDEAIEKAMEGIDTVIELLKDIEKAWIESERLRSLLFGSEKT
ncbi:MAG: PAS domain S-box protein, partial [Archaeoglobaceae archaeon]